jgi:putative transposase
VKSGARRAKAAALLGLAPRTTERWRAAEVGDDRRAGPKTAPANKLSPAERARILEIINSEEYRDLPPTQIVPMLADKGQYVGSESSIYRLIREARQGQHRERSRPATHKPKEHVATGPNQVWSWDITYLRTPIKGQFVFLYLVMDIWSRKIVGSRVHDAESMEVSSELVAEIAAAENIDADRIVLHADNGGPMKGATMLATLQKLGIAASFSRPSVSNDNAFSESLFRTLKYRPEYPTQPFETTQEAAAWVAAFVDWYNTEHRHSAIRMVTPYQRHAGADVAVLERRHRVYQEARRRNPNRWSGKTRDWSRPGAVTLNPDAQSAA